MPLPPRTHRDRLIAPVLALALGAATAASANFTRFLQHTGDHLLCCGPRGGVNLDAAVATRAVLADRVTAPRARATVASAAPAARARMVAAAAPAAARMDGDYELVGFDRLAAFAFNPPEYGPDGTAKPTAPDQIPESIKALDTRKVAVAGFMLPVKMEEGLVKEFLLVRDPMMCCYGIMPKVNEWIVVKMTGKGVQPLMDVPLTFYGKLRVGEMFESGYLTGIYLLEGERMGAVKG